MVAGEDAAASEGEDAVVSEKMVESGDAVAVKETVTVKDAAAVEEMEMTVQLQGKRRMHVSIYQWWKMQLQGKRWLHVKTQRRVKVKTQW